MSTYLADNKTFQYYIKFQYCQLCKSNTEFNTLGHRLALCQSTCNTHHILRKSKRKLHDYIKCRGIPTSIYYLHLLYKTESPGCCIYHHNVSCLSWQQMICKQCAANK